MIETIIFWFSILVLVLTFLIHLGVACIYASKPSADQLTFWFWELLFRRWNDYNFIVIYIAFGFCIWTTF